MDPDTLVLEISSDEDADWNDNRRAVSDCGDDYTWLVELFGEGNKENYEDDSDEVVVVSESEKPVKKSQSIVDLDDDCVVLDNDPNEPVEVRNDNPSNGDDDSDDVLVVSEKGQVAGRDYPHSRHLCIKFPLATTPNQSHCNQCYCYVCDSLAPCVYWGNGTASTDHCHATDKDEFWILKRKNAKNGCKVVQPITQLPSVDLHTAAAAMAQSLNQVPTLGTIQAHHTSANFRYPNIPSQYRNNVLASRTKLHPDLASQLVLRAHQRYNLGSRVHRQAFKRAGSVRVATTANPNPYRGNFGGQSRLQNYQVNGMPSRSSNSIGSLQPSDTSSTVNSQPLICQPQASNHPNLNFLSHVNSNPFPETMHYHQQHPVPPWPLRRQPASVQPSYPVSSKTRIDTPVVNFIHQSSPGNQPQGPVMDSGFKDCGLGWPAGQDSVTPECKVSANVPSLAGSLGDYQYDWIFEDQPIEPGFTDYSSDSAFIETGPIFNF